MTDFFWPTLILVSGILAGGFLCGWLQAVIVSGSLIVTIIGLAYLDARGGL